MKVTFWKAMQWWKKAKEEKKELSTLSITIEAFIPEENGPALNLEIEIRNIQATEETRWLSTGNQSSARWRRR